MNKYIVVCEYLGRCRSEIEMGRCITCIRNQQDSRTEDYYIPFKAGD